MEIHETDGDRITVRREAEVSGDKEVGDDFAVSSSVVHAFFVFFIIINIPYLLDKYMQLLLCMHTLSGS